jgi:dienelactone hydrolase
MGKYMLTVVVSCAFIFSACTDDLNLESRESEILHDEMAADNLYITKSYESSELKISLDVPYSVRPNYKGIQYTASNRKEIEAGLQTLTIHLDIAVPPNATSNTRRPLILYIHGGGFYKGKKENHRDEAFSYAQAGYVAATINYRLTANNKSSESLRTLAISHAVEDAMNAIRFLKSKASQYHIDASRIAVIGASDGGGIALMNAIGADELGLKSDHPTFSAIAHATISTGATLTKEPDQPSLDYDATDSPALLLHNRASDPITAATWQDAVNTQTLINSSGNKCTLVKQPENTHTENLSVGGKYWNDVLPFLQKHLRLQ